MAGSGRAVRRAVPRWRSPVTGHEVGRCRRIRSLYCLTGVAIFNKVRMTVEGCAGAQAV
jgi:hypothetical protein